MFRKLFKMWLADLFLDAILITIGIYIINLGYLEDRSLYFTELPNDGTEELNRILVWLDIVAVIQKIDIQNLPDIIDLEVK